MANSVHADPAGNTTNIATAVDRRALYSPFGAAALRKPDLVAPSHTAYGPALIDPILSAVRVGTGAVDGCPGAAVCNDYATTFGGTSHATPTVAGAIALMLSARPALNWIQVRDILRASCARIDAAQANATGAWQDLDGDGVIDYSRWYGAGRLDVDAAVGLALDDSRPLADVYVRENLADSGAVPSGGNWWDSPDIWVAQNAATPIPTLAWGSAPPHENARRGQDNAIFCRARNRGGTAASTVYVRAMLTHWAGLEFVYPADFEPTTNVGAALPNPLVPGTYLVGQARIDNLAAGADQIVKFNWPQALVPPETVIVSGVLVRWHPCLLVEASPHDGPAPVGGPSAPVQGNNNIAQRNITILNAGDADADSWVGMIAGSRLEAGVATLVIDASRLRGAGSVRLHLPDAVELSELWVSVREVERQGRPEPVLGGGNGDEPEDDGDCAVIVETRTRLRVGCRDCNVVIEAAPGSRVLTAPCGPARFKAGWVKHRGIDAVELSGLAGQVEIPLRLAGGRFMPLLVAATGAARGTLRITQRRGDGRFSAGYGVVWR
ncbi:MAG: S8 family serine peptidase [Rubrivivax sp.]|nr:S8 family serine peptidase [Rubrivivax sp.]